MLFCLAGSHRSGKSTLAKDIADALGIHYHDGSAGRIMKACGYNAVADMPIEQRVEAQEKALDYFLNELTSLPRPCITDRSPLDFLAYMLGEVSMHNTSPELATRISEYADKALEATMMNFDTVVIIRPFGSYLVEEGKPPPNEAYQWKIQWLIEGALRSISHQVGWMQINESDYATRLEVVSEHLSCRINDIQEELKLAKLN